MSSVPTPQQAPLATGSASYFTAAAMNLSDAAAEPVSALVAEQFTAHARMYQTVCAQVAVVHELLVAALGLGTASHEASDAVEQDGKSTTAP